MLITLLTDFGTQDAYVSQMKGQILSICPGATLVDVTHEVAPQDIAQAALLLCQAAPYFPPSTIHVAVVDPGVGTQRKLLAVEAELELEGSSTTSRQRFVLPDNGLVDLCLQRARGWTANYLTEQRFFRCHVSSTFHGRDIMGPVAAHWATGVGQDQFGPACLRPQQLNWPRPEIAPDAFHLHVIAVDHFGNLITNLEKSQATFLGATRVMVSWAGGQLCVPISQTYGQHKRDEPLLLVGSHGFVELSVVCGHAAHQLGISRGQRLTISPVT